MEAQSLNSLNSRKRIVGILVTALLLLGIVVPITVLADEPFTIDTTLLSATDEPTSYAGGKDAAFAIDGDSLKLSYEIQGTRNGRKWEFSDESYKPVIGYSNKTVMEWFGPVPANQWRDFSVKLNEVELSTETTENSYYSVEKNWDSPGNPKFSLTIKPGVEITDDFFATNKIEIVSTSDGETISVGTYVEEPSGPFSVDTTLMSATDEPTSYAGGKDAAFAVDGNTLKLSYEVTGTRNGRKWEFSDESYKPISGYSNKTVMEWFGPVPANQWRGFSVKLNGVELSNDTAGDSYYSVDQNWDSPGNPKFSLTIKPGVEISDDFFATNKIEIVSTSDGETVTVGKYSGVTPDPGTDPEPLKSAKTITPAEDYRVPSEANENNNLQLKISNDNDMDWASKLTQVTYSYDEGTPVEMALGSGNISYPYSGDPYMSVDSGDIAAKGDAKSTILIGVRYSFFQNQNIPKGETREYTFTFKADGYEDSVVKQTVRNPKEVLEVAVDKGVKYSFALEDLQKMWKDEGSKEYTYSTYNTFPTYETETFYGPTVKGLLAAANIDVESLADDDVIVFTASDGYTSKITVKDFNEKRYFFPNGKTPDDSKFLGTTAAQLEDKVEVPYIVSLKDGESNLRNIFGQRDPQEEQKNDYNKYLSKITIQKGAASTYDGLTPTIESGSAVKAGDKLNFDFSTSDWQGGSARYAYIYYTVSTDGTEPADPTLSDILYNYHQYGSPNYNDNPEYFNSYEFTDAETTIIKVMTYIRGYAEPVVQTLRYENAATQEMICELTSSEGTELKAKKQTTLTAEVKNGTGDYEYKFIVYNKTTNQWYKLRDFAPENTFDWYTGPGGEKNLYVDVKDKTTGEVKRFQLDVNVAESDLAVTSFTSSAGTELVTKAHTTLTAVAEKGTAPYEYKFIVYNETTQQWYKLKDFGSESTFDWYTGPEGSKKLYVDVKDADGTVVRKELAVNVSEAASAQLDNAA